MGNSYRFEIFIMALLKTINAAYYGYVTQNGLLERFSLTGNVLSRNATPKVWGHNSASRKYYYPSTTFNASPSPSSDTVTFKLSLVEDEAYMFRALFPEGTSSDDGTFEIPKNFTAENAGGESVAVSDSIDSIEIAGPVFNIPIELELFSESSTTKDGVRTEIQYYKGEYSSSIIPGFDTSIPLVNQFLAGIFNNLVSAETSTFQIQYNKKLMTPATWKDGATSILYSQYCLLTPVNPEFKRSMNVNFRFDASLKTFTINIRNIYMTTDKQVFWQVRF